MKSVCIFNLGIGDILYNPGLVGGAEIQQLFLAEELVQRGYEVNIITFLHSDPTKNDRPFSFNRNGINIELIPIDEHRQVKILERIKIFFKIFSLLRTVKSDIFTQMGLNYDTLLISIFCILFRKKFVFFVASDKDIIEPPGYKRSVIKRFFLNFGISTASLVIAQSDDQRKRYSKIRKQKCCVVKSIYPPKQDHIEKKSPPVILWVGTVKPVWKRPEILLQLARSIPHAQFQMIGGPAKDLAFYQDIENEAKKIPNLDFRGFVPDTAEFFLEASIFVNTSDVEGFPNTFIEAWLSRMPIVSLEINPDDIICKNKMGFHSKTFDQMVKDIETLIADPDLRDQMGRNGQGYVKREHDVKKNVDQFIRYVAELF